jgi:hypothetical protein
MLGDRKTTGPKVFHFWVGNLDGTMRPSPMTFSGSFFPPADSLTAGGFQLCLAKAVQDETPPLEWLFLRDARSLHNAGDWRRAVIDAATASEIAITEWLDRRLDATELAVKSALLSRPRPLGPLTDLFSTLGGELPAGFKNQLVNPRNRAAHGGNFLSAAESEAAINSATTLLTATSPLRDYSSPSSAASA